MRPSLPFVWLALATLGACDEPTGAEGFMTHWPPASYAHDLSHGNLAQSSEPINIVPWGSMVISYAVDADGAPVDRDTFRAEVRAALDEWSRVTEQRRQFYEVEDPLTAQFVFAFRTRDHRETCDEGFTNADNTIAHAFTSDSKCLAGVVHLNAGLEWYTDGSNRFGTYDVRSALLHETGHLIGLGHFETPGHIMFHEYVGVVRRLTDAEGDDAIGVIVEEDP